MGGISKSEVAERAGVDLDYVTRLIDVGVLAPAADGTFTDGDARRARLYQGLERAGLPIDALVEATERGELSFEFLEHPVYDRFARLTSRSFREVSSEEGIPLELLLVVREAVGLAQADADDQVREDELQVVPLIRRQLSMGFDPVVLERMLRVYGDALRRITETEADWWRTQITQPSLASGMSMTEFLRTAAELGGEVTSLAEQAMLAIYHANQEHTWNENLFEEVEEALDRAGLRSKIATSPAICFLDIAGYTRLTEERGDEAAAELAARLTPLVERPAERHGGKVVKWLGDGVMFHFREPTGGVVAALEMLDAVSNADLPPAHIGLHTGPVVFQGGDYFGRTVNLAARIGEQAAPGQVLVTQEIVDRVVADGIAFEPIGAVELKGVSEPVPLHSVTR
ncbi:MAG: adenylate/guanylate cyclase domain-containing protein [Actinomycetota bacterium]